MKTIYTIAGVPYTLEVDPVHGLVLQKRVGATILPHSRRQERRRQSSSEWNSPAKSISDFGGTAERYFTSEPLAGRIVKPDAQNMAGRVQTLANQAVGNSKAMMQTILQSLPATANVRFINSTKGKPDKETKQVPLHNFTEAIQEKMVRKPKYRTLDNMSDMVRGRISVDNAQDLGNVLHLLENKLGWKRGKDSGGILTSLNTPKADRFQASGYPRYHMEFRDPQTGIRHELQVGTHETDHFLEGVPVPHPTKGMGNFHDYYDVFVGGKLTRENRPDIWQKYGVDQFHRQFANTLRNTGNPDPNAKFWRMAGDRKQHYEGLADQAGEILRSIERDHPGLLAWANAKGNPDMRSRSERSSLRANLQRIGGR